MTRKQAINKARRLSKQLSDFYETLDEQYRDWEAYEARRHLAKASDEALIAAHWLSDEESK